MRKLSTIALAAFLIASSASAHSGGLNADGCHAGSKPYHCHRNTERAPSSAYSPDPAIDRDCGDFSNWRDAQDFYEASGDADPHGLDADNDGIACETLR